MNTVYTDGVTINAGLNHITIMPKAFYNIELTPQDSYN